MKVRLHNGNQEWVVDVLYVRATTPVNIFGDSGAIDVSIPITGKQAWIRTPDAVGYGGPPVLYLEGAA